MALASIQAGFLVLGRDEPGIAEANIARVSIHTLAIRADLTTVFPKSRALVLILARMILIHRHSLRTDALERPEGIFALSALAES